MRRRNPLGPRRTARLAMLLLAGLPSVAAASDPYPQGALAFFDLQSCPDGWSPAMGATNQPLNGYFVVPFAQPVPPGTLGATVYSPLAAGEDLTHTHPYGSQISLDDFMYIAASDHDTALAWSGARSFTGTAWHASAGLPYVSYLFCEKTAFAPNHNPPAGIPQYLAAFFLEATCPVGWKPALTTAGRLIVALPAAGTPGISFGGYPLAVGEDRTHTHDFSGQVSVVPQNVCADTGCCNDLWGKAGTYDFSGTTEAASTGLPYVIVSQCQTCLPGDADPACKGQ